LELLQSVWKVRVKGFSLPGREVLGLKFDAPGQVLEG